MIKTSGILLFFLLAAVSATNEAPPQEEIDPTPLQQHEFLFNNKEEQNLPGIVMEATSGSSQPQQESFEIGASIYDEHESVFGSSSSLRPRVLNENNEDDGLGFWPFSPHSPEKDDASCAGQTDCQSCVAHSSWCHWCEKQNECHSKGSFYGCFSGAQCDAKNHTVDPDDQHGCASHGTCSDCATASRFCHWCAHDQACHAIGSVYGCATGVDCYSNDRCQRKTPERLPWVGWFPTMSQLHALPVAIVLGVAAFVGCCATVCFCVCSGVKGAYDDLTVFASPDPTEPLLTGNEIDHDENYNEITLPIDNTEPVHDHEDAADQGVDTAEESFVSAVEEGEATAENHPIPNQNQPEAEDAPMQPSNNEENEAADGVETDPLLSVPMTSSARRRSIRPRRPRHMQRLYNACTACYAITIFTMCIMVFCSFYFYPQMPVYNICNDNVAWKSIIDSMKTMHTQADFEILASLKNPNRISVALDQGTGYFHHNGKFAGSFTIPPFTAEAMSITDFLLIAHLSPGTWDAVQIATEYAEGHLILHVNTTVVIRVPALADFTYQGSMDNITVYVNEVLDRSLCACPTWDDARNHSHKKGAFGLDPLQSGKISLQLPFLEDEEDD